MGITSHHMQQCGTRGLLIKLRRGKKPACALALSEYADQ